MIYTSYFAKNGKHPNAVAISAKVPDFYTGKRCIKLAPSWSIFNEWKILGNEETYTNRFVLEVLDKLDPQRILLEIGNDAVLLCYEASGKFCHRHIVAEWLQEKLNITISEL